MNRAKRILLVVVLLSGLGGVANAYSFARCAERDNQPYKWLHQFVLTVNTTTIPKYSLPYWTLARTLWNMESVVDLPSEIRFSEDADYQLGDGVNEIIMADPATIDGQDGFTRYIYSCSGPRPEIVEADVILSNKLWYHTTELITYHTNGRAVIQHEMGHLWGLQHSDQFSVMHAPSPLPLQGGGEPAGLFSDDVAGLRDLYWSWRQGWKDIDLWISPQRMARSFGPSTEIFNGTERWPTKACAGQSITGAFTMGNAGWVNAGAVTVSVYVSMAKLPDAYNWPQHEIGRFVVDLPALSTKEFWGNMRIPKIRDGTWNIYIRLDPDGRVADKWRGNNVTLHAGMLLYDSTGTGCAG